MAKKPNNDDKIISLKKQVEEKKSQLAAAKGFSPKTNCSFMLNGDRVNLNVNDTTKLTETLVFVNALRISAEQLGLKDFKVQGFPAQDWIDDIKTRLTQIDRKQEEERLKSLEKDLHDLLTLDKKVELKIQELEGKI